MEWHSISADEALKALKSSRSKGLTNIEAAARRETYGKNIIDAAHKSSVIRRFFSQFKDFMIIILLAAAGISFVTAFFGDGDFTEPIMIVLIVIINAAVGTIQECKAENAIEALKKLSSPEAEVLRGGKHISIPSEDLVKGDIIFVKAGDMVCADARLLESVSLRADESSLTGESVPVEKCHDICLSPEAPLAERSNMIFSSSCITSGRAEAVVTETGMNTRVGKIAHMINTETSPPTPLQKSLEKTGKILGAAALGICALIFILGSIQKVPPLEMFMISISLAVAAIPEGLPAVVTIVLALGVRKMAQRRAIVRRLPAVESLGRADVICSDKTGTLTLNRMTVTSLSTCDGHVGLHTPSGKFILTAAAMCCDPVSEAAGDPTETAVLDAASSCSLVKSRIDEEFPRKAEQPFDSVKKRMITVHSLKNGGYRTAVKGAPDILISLCTKVRTSEGIVSMSDHYRKKLFALNESYAEKAMRVIAVAYKDDPALPSPAQYEKGLVFCGLIAMNDPPRPQAASAVAICKKAGIKPVMITGDHIVTAKAIARKLNIYTEGSHAITGAELDKLSDSELRKTAASCSVFARVTPEHKVRIVKAFQSCGYVTAMTGDGVNDAPALRTADIGCAMGISGTDVAKSAADIILTDDNFSTIVEAVEQGRGIYENIRRTIHFLLSSNVGEILTVLCAFLMKLPSPLLAIQLLWVNLVTDSLPALALGAEPVPDDIMEKKPSAAKGSIFKGSTKHIIIEGFFIGALAFLAFTIGRVFFDGGEEPITGRTMTFAVLSLSQLVHSFNLRSEHSLFRVGISGNKWLIFAFLIGTVMQISVITVPFLSSIFRTVPLSPVQWLIVALLSLSPLLIVEIEKRSGGFHEKVPTTPPKANM